MDLYVSGSFRGDSPQIKDLSFEDGDESYTVSGTVGKIYTNPRREFATVLTDIKAQKGGNVVPSNSIFLNIAGKKLIQQPLLKVESAVIRGKRYRLELIA